MKKRRQLISLLLAAVMASALIGGCGQKTQNTQNSQETQEADTGEAPGEGTLARTIRSRFL